MSSSSNQNKKNEEHEEYQYLNLVRKAIDEGHKRIDRTKVGTKAIFGEAMRFSLRDGKFPLLTTKKTYWKGIVEELLWFISGSTNANDLSKKGVKIWDANGSREFLDNRGLKHREIGDLGPIYGWQWRHFGAEYKDMHSDYTGLGIDQLAEVIKKIKYDPYNRRIIMSAWNVSDLEMMALPPCFSAGTLVLTDRGYIPIEKVTVEDKLISHTGELRNVNQVHVTNYKGIMHHISTEYRPFAIKTTPEHPFYLKKQEYGSYRPTCRDLKTSDLEPGIWVKAEHVRKGDFIGFPINKKSNIYSFEYEKKVNQYTKKTFSWILDNPEYWFTFGYYLGDGWLDWSENGKYRFYMVFNDRDMREVYPRITKVVKLSEVKTRSTGCKKFEGRNFEWWSLLKDFGHLAHNKRIPEWVHDAPKNLIKKFIEGYIAADGCKTMKHKLICATTTSPHIAFGMQRLYSKLNHIVGVRYQIKPKTHIIEDRVVNQRNLYHIDKNLNSTKRTSSHIEDGYVWFAVKSTLPKIKKELVYNFDVDVDHTYIVENLAVHNCHLMCQFFVSKGELSCQMYQRSADLGLGVPFNIASYALLTIMIAHVCGLKPGEFIHSLGDTHIYLNHIEALEKQLKRKPYEFPTVSIKRKVSSIDDFKFDDFKLENYQSHPLIKMRMAV
jgi:thymidylate synthase